MSQLKVKVCGLATKATIAGVESLNPDFSGFIFFSRSQRFISPEQIGEMPRSGSSKRIGVVVNATIPQIIQLIQVAKLDGIQLHGDEEAEFSCTLRQELANQALNSRIIIKAIRVGCEEDIEQATIASEHCDYVLFDTASDGGLYGGTGKSFNWDFLHAYRGSAPVILSGGIDENFLPAIREVASTINLGGVDINSKFEVSPGEKDISRVRIFLDKIRSL